MTVLGWRTAATAVLMATWWVTEALPIPATALLPLVLLPVLGVRSMEEAASPYANPVIYLFMGGFLIAAALERCGLHMRMALSIISFGGTAPPRLIGTFMVATAFLSMWVSNTATVAMMLPLAVSIVALVERTRAPGDAGRDANFPVALMLGLAYSASIGGLGTLIGTPPNALMAGFMSEAYQIEIGFVQWMFLGVPLVIIAIPVTWFLLVRVLFPLSTTPIAGGQAAIRKELDALGRPSRAEWTVGLITALTAAAWVTRPWLNTWVPGLSDAGIAIASATLLFVVPIDWRRFEAPLDWEAAERLPWGVLVLFGGGLSLAAAIQATGLAEWIGESLSWVGGWPLTPVTLVIATVVVFLTELTSNAATTAAFLPVVASLATAIGVQPILLVIPAAVSASCAFMLPVATPPNAIVYGSGRVTMPQMMRAGFVLNLVFIVLITALVVTLVPLVFGGNG
jgi:sodium-dependent dicarboxylate transporter 2/3/5